MVDNLFFTDGLTNWYFWGNWLILIGTILVTIIATFVLAEDGELFEAVFFGFITGVFVWALLTIFVLLISLMFEIVLVVVCATLFLYFIAYLGSKFS